MNAPAIRQVGVNGRPIRNRAILTLADGQWTVVFPDLTVGASIYRAAIPTGYDTRIPRDVVAATLAALNPGLALDDGRIE